jgi:hypothetical protein
MQPDFLPQRNTLDRKEFQSYERIRKKKAAAGKTPAVLVNFVILRG